jgi:hypothetical protein
VGAGLLKDGTLGDQSVWFPSEGFCFHGQLQDELLDPLVRVQCTWNEWKRLHPETVVLVPPDDPHHKDARGGHGAEEYWGRPGMDNIFIGSVPMELDRRLPESEMIIAVNLPQGLRAYPFHDLKVHGGVANDELGDRKLVVLTGPEQDSAKALLFDRVVDGRELHFEIRDGAFVDTETGSTWSLEGEAVDGTYAGTQLEPVYFFITRWHSWCYTHPATDVWHTDRTAAPSLDLGALEPAFEAWRGIGHDVRVERAEINLERPLETDQTFRVRVDGDPFRLHLFVNALAAEDWVYFHPHSARRGTVVVESFPDEQYTDIATQAVRRPDHVIAWSKLLQSQEFLAPLDGVSPGEPEEVGFREIITGLGDEWDCYAGWQTPMTQDIPLHSPLLTTTGRFPGVTNGVYVTVGPEDPMVIYRFESEDRARHYVETENTHAVAVGRYVFRSIPINMFAYPRFGMYDRPEEKVDWSELLEDEQFLSDLRAIILEQDAAAA